MSVLVVVAVEVLYGVPLVVVFRTCVLPGWVVGSYPTQSLC